MSKPRFKCGDFVVSKLITEANRLWPQSEREAILTGKNVSLFHVVEVLSATCPGGTQHHYMCRAGADKGVSIDLFRFHEIELEMAPSRPIPEEKQT